MECCLLCLELKQEFVDTISVNSNQWHELKMKNILNKYLWSMDHITDNSWICTTCWTELYEFHKFYMRIKKAHRDLGLLKVNVEETEDIGSKNEVNEIAESPRNENPFEILVETTGAELKDFVNECDASDNHSKEEQKPLLKIEVHDESIDDKFVQKRKRGRPRKYDCDDKAKVILNDSKKHNNRKFEDICNDVVKSTDSSNKTKKRKQIKSKEIDTENTISNVNIDKQETNLISQSEEPRLSLNDGGSDNESDRESSELGEIKSNINTKGPSTIIRNEKDKFIAENFKMNCFLCDVPLDTFYNMRKHFELHHTEPGHIQCCNRKFYRRSLLIDHVHYHLNPNYFKCSKCDKVMEDRRRLELHIKTHDINSGKNHFCDVCGKGFLIVGVLNKHKMIHLSEEEKRFECSDCGKKFATNYMLTTHHRINHLKKYVKICDTCGKSIRDKDVFKRHMLRHEGKTAPVSCDVCGLLLTDNKALKRHKEVIHPVGGQKQYTCSICSKTSPNFRAHKLHVQFKHETGYNYKCTICDKAFKKAPSLKEHMASHTGTVLYTCPWCPKTFNSNANMHHHRKRVHPKEWEETSRRRYSGKLPPYFKPPTTTESSHSNVPKDV